MKLYHLSFDIDQPLTRTFFPRVPANKMEDEEIHLSRICFSHSILGCINALPGLEDKLSQNWDDEHCAAKAVLFTVDTEDLFARDFVDSNDLYEHGFVPDAIVNQECWYLSPLTLTGMVVDLRPSSDRVRWLYSAREQNRGFIYSVIDDVCNGYASKNREVLDDLSLDYIINDLFYTAKFPFELGPDLDFAFGDLAVRSDTSHLIDAFNAYPDFYVNDYLHCLMSPGMTSKAHFLDEPFSEDERPSLSSLISQAESCKSTVSVRFPEKKMER